MPDLLPSSFRSWNASETKLERLCGCIHLEWYGWNMMKYSCTKNGMIQNNFQIRVTQLRAGNISAKIEKMAWPSSFHQLVSMAQLVSTQKPIKPSISNHSARWIRWISGFSIFQAHGFHHPKIPSVAWRNSSRRCWNHRSRWIPVACLGLRLHSLGGHRGASDRSPEDDMAKHGPKMTGKHRKSYLVANYPRIVSGL